MSPKEAKQTQQEASLLARLNHPNIVSFWDSFLSGSSLYIVMEFADGRCQIFQMGIYNYQQILSNFKN
jgi:serine/threonine protein kinase